MEEIAGDHGNQRIPSNNLQATSHTLLSRRMLDTTFVNNNGRVKAKIVSYQKTIEWISDLLLLRRSNRDQPRDAAEDAHLTAFHCWFDATDPTNLPDEQINSGDRYCGRTYWVARAWPGQFYHPLRDAVRTDRQGVGEMSSNCVKPAASDDASQ